MITSYMFYVVLEVANSFQASDQILEQKVAIFTVLSDSSER